MTGLVLVMAIAQVVQAAVCCTAAILLLRKVRQTPDAKKAAPSPAGVAEKEGRDLMNEGFENIMGYSVNGKTGFESR